MKPALTLLFVLAVAFMGVGLSGCSGAGQSLAGDQLVDSKCPPGGCAGLIADKNQITISSHGRTTIYQTARPAPPATPTDIIELGGDCYASTYPNNRIEVTAFRGTTQVTLPAGSVINPRAVSTNPICVNGRFILAISGAPLISGYVYRLHVEVIGIDTEGAEFRNSGTGAFDINVSR
jgi:hypothetical protein